MKKNASNFVNEPSKRMYFFLNELVGNSDVTQLDIVTKFGTYINHPRNYFNALFKGTISVTVDQILKAQVHFGLNPCDLFAEGKDYIPVHGSRAFVLNERSFIMDEKTIEQQPAKLFRAFEERMIRVESYIEVIEKEVVNSRIANSDLQEQQVYEAFRAEVREVANRRFDESGK